LHVALDPYRGPYLTTAQVFQVLDTLEQAGVLWLVLTGGEIFTRRDFEQIYRRAKEKGFLVTLFTNATMVTDRIAAMLAEEPPFLVEVSIYGADAEHYEATTGIPGSFARFERGIERLMAAGVALVLKTTISSFTQDHLRAMKEWCDRRGLAYKVDRMLDVRHDGGQEPALYRIEPRKVKRIGELIDEVFQWEAPTVQADAGPLPECAVRESDHAGAEELYYCGAGRVSVFVDALGNASHWVIDREPSFPMLSMPWDELWTRMGEWVTQPLPADAPCSGCGLRGKCSNCPARARLATGDPYAKDPYFCDITHLDHGLEPASHADLRPAPRPLGACAA
jgi:MoaA/NifB/PqqE/SkfB family radical SAM enzyme